MTDLLNIDNLVIIKHGDRPFGIITYPKNSEVYKKFSEDITNVISGNILESDFETIYGFKHSCIIMFGKCMDVSSEDILPYIDRANVYNISTESTNPSYPCFCGKNRGFDYTKSVYHSTPKDSWRCLMAYTGNPYYGIVVDINYLNTYLNDVNPELVKQIKDALI